MELTFVKGVNTRDQGLQEKEKTYHDFLRSVGKIVGEEMSSEQLHSAAMFIYKELTSERTESDKKYVKRFIIIYGSSIVNLCSLGADYTINLVRTSQVYLLQ